MFISRSKKILPSQGKGQKGSEIMAGFDANAYIAEYKKNNYSAVQVILPKGKNKVLKAEAKKRGISISKLIINALETQYGLDLSKDGT